MKVKEIVEKLNLQVKAGSGALENEIYGGYASDLLSDVMGNAKEGHIWITMQSHQNIIAVAALKDLAAIVITGKNTPLQETIDQAENENIPLLTSGMGAFELSGNIYGLINEKT